MANVWVAMSGGVDSAVSAFLLKQQGHCCTGVTMRLIDGVLCPGYDGETAVADAKAACDRASIPFCSVDYTEIFREQVVAPFISIYEAGQTPNPCLYCNRHLKFGALLREALQNGADYLATGHYARIEKRDGRYLLCKAKDAKKDQSYVLYMLTQEQLSHVLFPLGDSTKDEVRAIAEAQNLTAARKKESQDICFIPDGDHVSFLERHASAPSVPGEFVTRSGKVLGTHRGLIHYTVGQRKGLSLSLPEPHYVCEKDVEHNRVILCTKDALPTKELIVRDFNWISMEPPQTPVRACVRTRYHQVEQPATLTPLGDGKVKITFDGPGATVAPGQAAVAYDGDVVLGGGCANTTDGFQ